MRACCRTVGSRTQAGARRSEFAPRQGSDPVRFRTRFHSFSNSRKLDDTLYARFILEMSIRSLLSDRFSSCTQLYYCFVRVDSCGAIRATNSRSPFRRYSAVPFPDGVTEKFIDASYVATGLTDADNKALHGAVFRRLELNDNRIRNGRYYRFLRGFFQGESHDDLVLVFARNSWSRRLRDHR